MFIICDNCEKHFSLSGKKYINKTDSTILFCILASNFISKKIITQMNTALFPRILLVYNPMRCNVFKICQRRHGQAACTGDTDIRVNLLY